MTQVMISVDTKPGWSQRMASTLDSEAVEIRMQRLACHESNRLPSREIIVRACDDQGSGWKILHWPVDALAYWEIR